MDEIKTETNEHLEYYQSILGKEFVIWDIDSLQHYAHDETLDLHFLPDIVLKPKTTNEVSLIMRHCNKYRIPVTPRGAGTGLSGGALPHLGGVVLSTERMNQILNIDERNLQVTTEPGVITEVLQNAVKEKGLFYPPDPHSKGSCFIGGNVAENSGGPKAVKYGVVKDYVLNLEIVLPNGDVIWTGANVLKNATGYNLTQLVVGSEGTLGIVTKIVLKLIPFPKYDLLIRAPFDSIEKACAAVSAIFISGNTPSAIEFMDRDAIDMAMEFNEETRLDPSDKTQAHLLIEVDGNNLDVLMHEIESISEVLNSFGCNDILFAEDASQKERLWKLRKIAGEAARAFSPYLEEDTVVPRAELPTLVKGIKKIGKKFGFRSICVGHAGDGNIHVIIFREILTDEQWENEVKDGIREIFVLVKNLNGTISAEHGIGLVQKEFMEIIYDPIQMDLMKSIKKVFDPNNILNAGKIFDI
tara:strand:+ start:14760 stop:16169 length:1410 start_codon:yes stop_codon:yes gene_type:complete